MGWPNLLLCRSYMYPVNRAQVRHHKESDIFTECREDKGFYNTAIITIVIISLGKVVLGSSDGAYP